MSGLKCCVCETPWKSDKPLLYHLGKLHCSTFACSRECEECKDDIEAVSVVEGVSTNVEKPPQSEKRSEPKPAEFVKALGYADMMKRLKGGT